MGTLQFTLKELPIDRLTIPQDVLDLDSRGRTNVFPWRGQFSPCLVEALLSVYSTATDRVLDPFAGVGTTLFEAARMQLASFGTEINPSAVAMAQTVAFLPLERKERLDRIESVKSLLERTFGYGLPLFEQDQRDVKNRLRSLIAETSSALERSLLMNSLIRGLKSADELEVADLHRSLAQHAELVLSLPVSNRECRVYQADARRTGVPDAAVDLIVTSPPYINVFNYHQNNRPAMELLGYDLLDVAKSEFGSNRKNRGNRFLTVIQYCLDLHATFKEIRRVIKRSGRAILVLGRESNVRGVAFQNGCLAASVAEMAGFTLNTRQERKFKNMFGEMIYEDILHLRPSDYHPFEGARELAIRSLEESLNQNCSSDAKSDIREAIRGAHQVSASPIFAPSPKSLLSAPV